MEKIRTYLFWITFGLFSFSVMAASETGGKVREGIYYPIDRASVATDVTVMLTEIISAKDATDKFVSEHQWTPESISQFATTLGYYKAQLETLANATPQMVSDVRQGISQIDEPDIAFTLVSAMNYLSGLFILALVLLVLAMRITTEQQLNTHPANPKPITKNPMTDRPEITNKQALAALVGIIGSAVWTWIVLGVTLDRYDFTFGVKMALIAILALQTYLNIKYTWRTPLHKFATLGTVLMLIFTIFWPTSG